MDSASDNFYMRRALKLARKGECTVSPNPMVGCVIVRDGRIVGEGWHACCGENHAEINAIEQATEPVAEATVYVTLEPCSHFGRTPPCVQRLIAERPSRVVVGVTDPNPLVAGRGIAALRAEGIAVSTGILEEECRALNEVFFTYITTGRPYVTLKYASTLDGRIASATGHSRWISSPASRRFAHALRAASDAILVGSGTVLLDDPELTTRLVKGKNPLRVVLDSRLRLPLTAKVLNVEDGAQTLIVASPDAPGEKASALRARGVEILLLPSRGQDGADLPGLLDALGKRQVASVLIEGGSKVITSVLKQGLAHRVVADLSPKIIGKGIAAVGDLGLRSMDEAIRFPRVRIRKSGGDIIFDLRRTC